MIRQYSAVPHFYLIDLEPGDLHPKTGQPTLESIEGYAIQNARDRFAAETPESYIPVDSTFVVQYENWEPGQGTPRARVSFRFYIAHFTEHIMPLQIRAANGQTESALLDPQPPEIERGDLEDGGMR